MRTFTRTSLMVALCLVLATPAGAARSRRSEHPPSMRELRREANEAAGRYADAQALVSEVDDQVVALHRQIFGLENRIAPLRTAITRRTVAVYQKGRTFGALTPLEGENDPIASGRAARLMAISNENDLELIESLSASVDDLRSRQERLETKRAERTEAADAVQVERSAVEDKLMAMQRAGSELAARLSRAKRARWASRNGRVGAAAAPAVPAVDPASIPVAVNFICPIRGPVAFTDTWGDARGGGRGHQGVDMMNPHGTDNVAVVSGIIERHDSGAGGISIYLHGDDGHTYFYAHLAEVVGPDRRVARGEVIGRTGATGNARGGSPHTHFEIHSNGGGAVNPYPTVAAHC
ncbi:MAG: murein hydrolase activator EnvC family protein [Acidimicrobiia bacterium]